MQLGRAGQWTVIRGSVWWHLSQREQRVFYESVSPESRHAWNWHHSLPFGIIAKASPSCSLVSSPSGTSGIAGWLCPFLRLCFPLQHSQLEMHKGFMSLLKLYTKFCVFLCLRKAIIFIIFTKKVNNPFPPN